MQLVRERCTVRPWRLDDAQSLASHANNRKIWLGVRDLFPHPHASWKKPVSLSKGASRTT
jgi:hypothetical protein